MSNTTGATSGAGTVYPSGAHEFNPCFRWVRVVQVLILCVVVLGPLFFFAGFYSLWAYVVYPSNKGYCLAFKLVLVCFGKI